MLDGENIALLLCRQLSTGAFRHVLVTDLMSDNSTVSTASKERSYHLPLYRYEEIMGQVVKVSNLNLDTVRRMISPADLADDADGDDFQKDKRVKGTSEEKTFSPFSLLSKNHQIESASSAQSAGDSNTNLVPEEFIAYCYAVLHSPTYRERYKEFLKIDFPRIPLPKSAADYRRLVALGQRLIDLHLMRVDFPSDALPNFPIIGSNIVEEARFSSDSSSSSNASDTRISRTSSIPRTGRVYINATQYFDNVPESSFNFFIGGYQPAQKWLKDRKGRTLTNADLTHYRRLIATFTATAALMSEIG